MAVGPESCHAHTYITFLLKKKLCDLRMSVCFRVFCKATIKHKISSEPKDQG